MLEILRYFVDNVPHAVAAVKETLPHDFSPPVYEAITDRLLWVHSRLQNAMAALASG